MFHWLDNTTKRTLDWIYSKAPYKKTAFALGGAGVALSTAISHTSPLISWIANLVSITFGGGLYSSLKNMETSNSISAKQKEIVALTKKLDLRHRYLRLSAEELFNPLNSIVEKFSVPNEVEGTVSIVNLGGEGTSSSVPITQQTTLSATLHRIVPQLRSNSVEENIDVAALESKICHCISSPNHASDSRVFANRNFLFQTLCSIVTIVVNAIANTEQIQPSANTSSSSNSDADDSGLTTKNIANIVVVFACVSAQTLFHTVYAAKNLRLQADEVEELKGTLSKIKTDVLFQGLEYHGCLFSRKKIDNELARCDREIERLNDTAGAKEQQLQTTTSEQAIKIAEEVEKIQEQSSAQQQQKTSLKIERDQLAYPEEEAQQKAAMIFNTVLQ